MIGKSKRPTLRSFKKPLHIKDYPVGPAFEAGHLTSTNAAWRIVKPKIDHKACVKCLRCYLVCPEGSVFIADSGIDIDYDFCKGCGICARECRPKAISMEKEQRE